jgi:hypothetical protein
MSPKSNPKIASGIDDLDRPIYGAENIGREAGLLDDKGNVKLRPTYHALEQGFIDASKFGAQWVSTSRRIRRAFIGKTA